MITAYRDHAHPLVLGTDPKYVMAELYGRRTGTSKGKGGSMHMFDKERNLFEGTELSVDRLVWEQVLLSQTSTAMRTT